MRRIFAVAIATLTALSPATAAAQSGPRTEGDVAGAQGVYQAEVPVNGQGESDRNSGLARALGQVLAKISGDRGVTAKPGVATELRNAENYVDSYDFRQDQGVSPSGAPTFGTVLVARFKPEAVNGLASALGLGIWPQPRPKPVLWLAIDDGSGPRLVGLTQANAARSALSQAKSRGYALGLPAGNAAEQALVGAIWRQDVAAVARASSRYSPPMQLVGKLYRAGAGWKADWVFVDGGKVLSKWSSSDSDARRAMSGGADGAADALIKRYAKRGSAGPAGSYRVVFTGVDGADDYIRLSAALQRMAVVRKITPVAAHGDTYEVNLDLVSGLPGFKRMVGDDAPFTGGEGDPPVYQMK